MAWNRARTYQRRRREYRRDRAGGHRSEPGLLAAPIRLYLRASDRTPPLQAIDGRLLGQQGETISPTLDELAVRPPWLPSDDAPAEADVDVSAFALRRPGRWRVPDALHTPEPFWPAPTWPSPLKAQKAFVEGHVAGLPQPSWRPWLRCPPRPSTLPNPGPQGRQQGPMSVRQSVFSVPMGVARRTVTVRLGARSLEVISGGATVARQERGLHKGTEYLEWNTPLEIIQRGPGALRRTTALALARRPAPSPPEAVLGPGSAQTRSLCPGRVRLWVYSRICRSAYDPILSFDVQPDV